MGETDFRVIDRQGQNRELVLRHLAIRQDEAVTETSPLAKENKPNDRPSYTKREQPAEPKEPAKLENDDKQTSEEA